MGNKRPKNVAEQQLYDGLIAKGWEVTRKGMPDFACYKNGELVLIEVKPRRSERLKRDQYRLLTALAGHGVRCFRWAPDVGFQQITPIVHDINQPTKSYEITGPPLIPSRSPFQEKE